MVKLQLPDLDVLYCAVMTAAAQLQYWKYMLCKNHILIEEYFTGVWQVHDQVAFGSTHMRYCAPIKASFTFQWMVATVHSSHCKTSSHNAD